jgi:hypothetical protein
MHIFVLCVDFGDLGEEFVDEAELASLRRDMERGPAILRCGSARAAVEGSGDGMKGGENMSDSSGLQYGTAAVVLKQRMASDSPAWLRKWAWGAARGGKGGRGPLGSGSEGRCLSTLRRDERGGGKAGGTQGAGLVSETGSQQALGRVDGGWLVAARNGGAISHGGVEGWAGAHARKARAGRLPMQQQ